MDIIKLAELSVISLDEGNLQGDSSLKQELENIVKSVGLKAVDYNVRLTEDNAMELRSDRVEQSLPLEKTLMNAPKQQAGCFVVPKTVGED